MSVLHDEKRWRILVSKALPSGYPMPFNVAMILHSKEEDMVQVVAATFKDGVFKPDERPALSDSARVRLVVETINSDEDRRRDESWTLLQHLWSTSSLVSAGDRLTRQQLHERR